MTVHNRCRYLISAAMIAILGLTTASNAQDSGPTPATQTPQELFAAARAAAAARDDARAIDLLEQIVEAGGKPYVPTLRATEFERLRKKRRFVEVLEAMRPCREPARRQFDFWIGDWDVAGPQGQKVGRNLIQQLEGGCVLRENYEAGPYSGTSISFWDPSSERWHQTWIDNQGNPLYMDGNVVGTAMVLSGESGGATQRTTWTPLADGRVRQHWETSSDGGSTWTTVFDGYYTKRR